MSDTTDLYDTCIVLLQHFAWVESSHNVGDTEHVDRLLHAVDPDELRLALRDLRELSIRWKGVEDIEPWAFVDNGSGVPTVAVPLEDWRKIQRLQGLRDVTTGSETAAPHGAPASGEAETPPYVPGHLGYSVRVRCQ